MTATNCSLIFELPKEIGVRITGVDNVDHYSAVTFGTLQHGYNYDKKASPVSYAIFTFTFICSHFSYFLSKKITKKKLLFPLGSLPTETDASNTGVCYGY